MITKLDNVCYNNNLLVSFLPLWVLSVNVCLLKTGPEACSERETDTPSPYIYPLAFLLLGIIVLVTGFFILFLRAQAVFAYNHQSLPPRWFARRFAVPPSHKVKAVDIFDNTLNENANYTKTIQLRG
jgi:hypothetical protein